MSSNAALSAAKRRRGAQQSNEIIDRSPQNVSSSQPQLTLPQLVMQMHKKLHMMETQIPNKFLELKEQISVEVSKELENVNASVGQNQGGGEIDLEALVNDMGFITERLQVIEQQLEKLNTNMIDIQSFSMKTHEGLESVKSDMKTNVETNDANVGENVETNDANVGENVETNDANVGENVEESKPQESNKGKNKGKKGKGKKNSENIVMEVEEALQS